VIERYCRVCGKQVFSLSAPHKPREKEGPVPNDYWYCSLGCKWEEEARVVVKCEKCGKEMDSYPFPFENLCLKCSLDKNFQSLGHFGEVPEPW